MCCNSWGRKESDTTEQLNTQARQPARSCRAQPSPAQGRQPNYRCHLKPAKGPGLAPAQRGRRNLLGRSPWACVDFTTLPKTNAK